MSKLLEDFIGWLETKDPNEKYEWADMDGQCLIGQFGAHLGLSWEETCLDDGIYERLRDEGVLSCEHPRTMGAALERARALNPDVVAA